MMTIQGGKDPNRGPFKLEYDAFPRYFYPSRYNLDDVTPKDLSAYNPDFDSEAATRDFRFQGFPSESFTRPREPVTLARAAPPPDQVAAQYFPQKRWFDTKGDHSETLDRPLGTGSAKGFRYGSEGHGSPAQGQGQPSGIRDPLRERTSAELLKYRLVQEEADQEFQKMKEDRRRKGVMQHEEKKRDMEQLRSYNPWGKPGGGAPQATGNGDFRKKRLDVSDDYTPRKGPHDARNMTSSIPGLMTQDFNDGFSKPGAGAPLRTSSGSLKTSLRGNQDIRFQNTKDGQRIFDNEVRYKNDNPQVKDRLKQELDAQQRELQERRNEERLENLRRDLEMAKHDPFGKPGAGAPNRHSAGHLVGRKITLTTNMDKLKANEKRDADNSRPRITNALQEPDYDPWGKGYGAPQRDQYGDVVRYRNAGQGTGVYTKTDSTPRKYDSYSDSAMDNSLNFERTRGGAGAPLRSENGHTRTRMPITMKRNEQGDASIHETQPRSMNDDPELAIWDPWGKSGGGAPLKEGGQIRSQVYGKMQNEKFSADIPIKMEAKERLRRDQQRLMEEHHREKIERDKDLKYGNGELAAIMKEKHVGNPRRDSAGMLVNQHLGTTDVTQERTNEKKFKNNQSREYLSELEKAASKRDYMRQLDKLKDKQEWIHHQESMNDFWGRPGGGAPLAKGNRKEHLDNMIHHSPRDPPAGYYAKNVPAGHQPYNYVRNTTNSTATNQYDFDPKFRTSQPPPQNGNYALGAPWAQNGEEIF